MVENIVANKIEFAKLCSTGQNRDIMKLPEKLDRVKLGPKKIATLKIHEHQMNGGLSELENLINHLMDTRQA